MAAPSDAEIHEFWTWFASTVAQLGADLANEAFLEEIDARVSRWELGWEIGPGITQRTAFALSPFHVPELLAVTRRIIALGPSIEGWELHPALPPKRWTLQFQLHHDDRVVEIDAREWRYLLTEYEDGTFDLTIIAPSLEAVAPELHATAADVLVEGMLGEERRMTVLVEIGVVLSADAEQEAHASPIGVLAKHLTQLLAASPGGE